MSDLRRDGSDCFMRIVQAQAKCCLSLLASTHYFQFFAVIIRFSVIECYRVLFLLSSVYNIPLLLLR